MLGTVLVSILAAWYGGEWNRLRRQRAVVQQLTANEGSVYWASQPQAWEALDNSQPPPSSGIARALLGDDAFAYVDTVYLHGVHEKTDASLALLPDLPKLQTLVVGGPHVTDESLKLIARNPRLTNLCIINSKITAKGLAHLGRLTQLTDLQLSGDEIQDETLRGLEQLSQLKSLDLSGKRITSAGLVHLRNLQDLRSLQLNSTAVADDGLPSLQSLSHLRGLVVGPNVTRAAAERLHKHLPNCAIAGYDQLARPLFHLKTGN